MGHNLKIRRRCKAHGKAGKQKVEQLTNKQRALKLRAKGKSFAEIAKELCVSVGTAYNYVNSGIEEINKQCEHEAKHLRRIELIRLDRLWKSLEKDFARTKSREHYVKLEYDEKQKKLIKKLSDKPRTIVNYSARVAIADRMLAIMGERRRYIPGLEVPKEQKFGMDEDTRREGMAAAAMTLEKKLTQLLDVTTHPHPVEAAAAEAAAAAAETPPPAVSKQEAPAAAAADAESPEEQALRERLQQLQEEKKKQQQQHLLH